MDNSANNSFAPVIHSKCTVYNQGEKNYNYKKYIFGNCQKIFMIFFNMKRVYLNNAQKGIKIWKKK